MLDQKFQLFNGIFGTSDEVLGSIGNGVDFEKRIAEIYNSCRTKEEITKAFDNLQSELQSQISDKMIAGGIKAIWNFTPFRIRVPENIVVQNTSLYAHLAVMFNRLNETIKK